MGFVRRSGRIAKEIRILLVGTDTAGHVFSEDTTTVVLSLHGAGIVSRHKLASEETLTLRLFGTSAEAAVRLIGQIGQETRGYTYGVEFIDPDLDFWELKFPPPMEYSDPDCELECSGCRTRQLVHQSEVEADVYALIRRILRFCARCGTSTVWQQAAADLAQTEVPAEAERHGIEAGPGETEEHAFEPADSSLAHSFGAASSYSSEPTLELSEVKSGVAVAVQEPAPFAVAPVPLPAKLGRVANRRRAVRTRVNFTAWVRHTELGDEKTECDNVSKGGFSFLSHKAYPVGSAIEVAVPYSPGWAPAFASARIRHVTELPGGKLFRYGAAYTVKPSK